MGRSDIPQAGVFGDEFEGGWTLLEVEIEAVCEDLLYVLRIWKALNFLQRIMVVQRFLFFLSSWAGKSQDLIKDYT